MQGPNPRVLMPTHRLLEPNVSWASAYEFQDVVCATDDVDLVAVQNVQPKPLRWEDSVLSRVRAKTGLDISRVPRRTKVRVKNRYDLLFIRVMTPGELRILDSIQGWQESCRIKVCWLEELWVELLQYEKWLQPLRQFDHVFVAQVRAPTLLSKIIGRPCSFLSPGVDALRFCPYPNPPARTIDFYSMGRRSSATHQSLRRYAKRRDGFTYLYDSTLPTTFVEDHVEHRELTANLIKRSRYFLADRAKANFPDQTKGEQVFGPRFFEGAAGGALMVGEPPKCDTFDAYFDWPDATIPLDYGSTEIADVIDQLDADPGRVSRARQANVTHSLRRHDWAHRWQTVLETLGLDPRQALSERQTELERRAQRVEQEFEQTR